MNLIGKIFTVLIFVMALVFMTMAVMVYATHTNWRALVLRSQDEVNSSGGELGLKYQLATAKHDQEEARDALEKLTNSLETERVNKRDVVTKLETENDELRRERDNREKELQDAHKDAREAVATMHAMQNTLADLRTEVQALRDNIRKTQTEHDRQFKRVVALTDELHQSENEAKRLEDRQRTLVVDLARYRDLLRKNEINPQADPDAVLPKVDGVVLATPGSGLIEVSIGADDGLRKGHQLQVFRARTYLGRVEVLRAAPDKAVCKILPEYRKGAIRRGDRVASKLD